MRAPARRARGWIRGPAWDAVWSLNGLWLAVLLWWLARDRLEPRESSASDVYLWLTLLFWIGHRVGSSYLAFCTSAYRPLVRASPVRFIVIPCAITTLVFAAVLLPERVLPVAWERRVFWLVLLDYVFVTYHFASQHFGLLSLYRLRSDASPRLRRLDRFFALGVGGVLVIAAEVVAGTVAYQAEWLDPLLDVEWIVDHAAMLTWSGTALLALPTLVLLAVEWRRPGGTWPRALYIVSVALMTALAFHVEPLVFLMVWTAQHWLTATGLAGLVAAGDPAPGPSRWYRFWHRVNRRPALVVIVLAIVSAALMVPLEIEAQADPAARYGPEVFPALSRWLTDPRLVPWLVALGLTTGFVHYVLDRAVYRFSDPATRGAARGLLGD